jgi:hypothetical protein
MLLDIDITAVACVLSRLARADFDNPADPIRRQMHRHKPDVTDAAFRAEWMREGWLPNLCVNDNVETREPLLTCQVHIVDFAFDVASGLAREVEGADPVAQLRDVQELSMALALTQRLALVSLRPCDS